MKFPVLARIIHLLLAVVSGSPFSRSIGLKKGFELAEKIANEKGQTNPILFSVDTSMILPNEFTRRVWKATRCGISTYAPICYKQKNEEDGFWVQYG